MILEYRYIWKINEDIQAKVGIGEGNDSQTPYHNCRLSKQSDFQTENH